MKWDPYLIPRTVINSKWFKDLNVRRENLKLLDKNIKKKLFGFSLGNNFVNITPKVQATKTKIIKWDYIKLKKLLHSKRNNQQNEKGTYGMGENICKPPV